MMALALTVGLAFGLVVGATMAARTTTQAAISGPPVTSEARAHAAAARAQALAPAPMTAYRQLVANIKVAESRSDFAMQDRFANELSAMLSAQTIGSIYLEHARLESSLAAAKADREYHLASRLSRQLAAICGSETVKAQLEFCN
jgi:hypothetical protein